MHTSMHGIWPTSSAQPDPTRGRASTRRITIPGPIGASVTRLPLHRRPPHSTCRRHQALKVACRRHRDLSRPRRPPPYRQHHQHGYRRLHRRCNMSSAKTRATAAWLMAHATMVGQGRSFRCARAGLTVRTARPPRRFRRRHRCRLRPRLRRCTRRLRRRRHRHRRLHLRSRRRQHCPHPLLRLAHRRHLRVRRRRRRLRRRCARGNALMRSRFARRRVRVRRRALTSLFGACIL